MIDNNRFAYFLNVMHYCIWRGDIRVGHVLYKVIGDTVSLSVSDAGH